MISNQLGKHQSNPGSRRVVIVDDNPQVLQDLRQFFEMFNEVEIVGEASNGQEAIRLVQKLKPDVVVMDLEMPIMDGYEATQKLKANSATPRVVILSIHTGSEVQEKVKAAGADGFIIKGACYEVLVNAIFEK
jgi:DNA-binding NarL/FixJ family response regulator